MRMPNGLTPREPIARGQTGRLCKRRYGYQEMSPVPSEEFGRVEEFLEDFSGSEHHHQLCDHFDLSLVFSR